MKLNDDIRIVHTFVEMLENREIVCEALFIIANARCERGNVGEKDVPQHRSEHGPLEHHICDDERLGTRTLDNDDCFPGSEI